MTESTVSLPRLPAWRRLGRFATGLALATMLAACGGGSDSTDTGGGGGTPPGCTKTFEDSFGQTVTCAEMRALPGADFAGGDAGSGDAGADGTGADGAPIANATIRIRDVDGKEVTATTNDSGYFRVNIGGLKQPLVATVVRNGNPWKSGLVEVIQPGRSKFYTLNLTGLTDLVLSELAKASGVNGGSDAVTPSVLAANAAKLSQAITTVNQQVATQLQAQGINPSTFNPLTSAFRADSTGYDKVLDSVTIVKTSGGNTVFTPEPSAGTLGGTWAFSTVFEGQEYEQGEVPGSAVPSSQSLAGAVLDPLIDALGSTYTEGDYTYTWTGNGYTIVGPDVNITYTITSFSASNYAGCGSCGVGSTVSYDVSYNFSFSGTAGGQSIPLTSVASSERFVFRRIN